MNRFVMLSIYELHKHGQYSNRRLSMLVVDLLVKNHCSKGEKTIYIILT
jgi:hypothetical protein